MSNLIEVGPHRLLCGDLTDGAVERLMGDELADVTYTDPPWGQGLLTMFATGAGTTPRLPWPAFLDRLARTVVAHTKQGGPLFIEMGTRWEEDLRWALWREGLVPRVELSRWEVTYGGLKKPRPSLLFLVGSGGGRVVMPDPPHGQAVTRAALAPFVGPGTVVLDPCTGLGMTARVTVELGGVFRGVELNPARLERTVEWLRRRVHGRSS